MSTSPAPPYGTYNSVRSRNWEFTGHKDINEGCGGSKRTWTHGTDCKQNSMLGPKLLLKRRYGGAMTTRSTTRPALRTLLALTDGLPVSLAVVPEPAVDRLAERLSHHSDITVLQHGFAHRNHAPAEEKKTEYGRHRLGSEVSVEIMRGKDRLRYLFPKSIRSIFVPPWNRMDDRHIPLLFHTGLKRFQPSALQTKYRIATNQYAYRYNRLERHARICR